MGQEAARIECMGASAQASPNLRKAWVVRSSRGWSSPSKESSPTHGKTGRRTGEVLRVRRWRRSMTAKDGFQKRRMKIQNLTRHTVVLCTAEVPQGAPWRKHGEEAERCTFEGKDKENKGSEGTFADGIGKLKARCHQDC